MIVAVRGDTPGAWAVKTKDAGFPACVIVRVAAASASVAVAVIAKLAIHLSFYKLLRIPLPWGIFERFAF